MSKETYVRKGLYQIKRVKVDLRDPNKKFGDAETDVNSVLNEMQQDKNVEILNVVDVTVNNSTPMLLIQYLDHGLED